jgi:predicted Ser/Thr protein kinase
MELLREYNLKERLAQLLNEFSQENASNTPDFVLANYLEQCLDAFNAATREREKFYGRVCNGEVKQYADEMQATELDELRR